MPTTLPLPAGLARGAMLIATLVGLAAVPALSGAARAAEPLAFAVPLEDGYGIGDCLEQGQSCGAAIADSLCEAHGHVKAVAFGLASDVTGSIPSPTRAAAAPPGDVLIRCTD